MREAQEILQGLGLPTTIMAGRFNALESFTANPSGPGKLVGAGFVTVSQLHTYPTGRTCTTYKPFYCGFRSRLVASWYRQEGIALSSKNGFSSCRYTRGRWLC